MSKIEKANEANSELLAEIGKVSFIESHGSSAPLEDIGRYINGKYTREILKAELSDAKNIFHLIYSEEKIAGYSKIILNEGISTLNVKNITKLDRLFLLKEFYDLKLGFELLQFNIELSKKNNQVGMWLYAWKENYRAVRFYEKNGFEIIGSHDFALSETHSNPNHVMFLRYLPRLHKV